MKIDGLTLQHDTTLHVDKDGMGRLIIPKLMTQALRLTRGDGISLKCELKANELKIRKNGDVE